MERELPVEEILPDLKVALASHGNAVLIAPPGAGKSTVVPLALLDEQWLQGQRIVMLEPRRLAARAVARYMARSLGEQVGQTVGYRVRLDTKVGPNTRIEVITEGILIRMLQQDPALENIGAVIFDEFHERSLQADMGLAFCLQSQAVLREGLRILVMSATLAAEPLARLLGGAPVLLSESRVYPVVTHYLKQLATGRKEPIVVRAVLTALADSEGDILVFLPGAAEIRRVKAGLQASGLAENIRILPLFGSLPLPAQEAAIAPSLPGQRKIVLATSIAETSLTVAGVHIVIDSGLMRVARFSPRTGMTRLETVAVSQAAADQRRGRAGRLGPGICYRLWTKEEDMHLIPGSTPEILEADLAPLVLELAVWGAQPDELCWLDAPPVAAFTQARELLGELGALDEAGIITPHGRQMAAAGIHPRLAHMILAAIPLKLGNLACDLAAILSERDVLLSSGAAYDADVRSRVEALHRHSSEDAPAYRQLRAERDSLLRLFAIIPGSIDNSDACGLLLAYAYPDRIAQRRSDGRYLLRNGRGAVLFSGGQQLSGESYLVAAELDDQGGESRILLAAPIELKDIKRHFGDQLKEDITVVWDEAMQMVQARHSEKLGALVLKSGAVSQPDPTAVLLALLDGITRTGVNILPWTKKARQLQQRLAFMHYWQAGWRDVSDEALADTLDEWLGPYLYGMTSRSDLQRLNITDILLSLLTWDERRQLDEFAPSHITVPSGRLIAVDYSQPDSPVLAVRLQEMFGLTATPVVGDGKVPLTLHLLSPAQRPVQVTRDLASFWRSTYYEVRKDLLGRYPKHCWPEDPLQAPATYRVRPAGQKQ